MSSNALATVDFNQLPSVSAVSEAAFEEMSRGGDFLPRVQLVTKGKYVDKGLIKPGHYGIPVSADEITDLGDSIDILPLAIRPKAIDMSDKPVVSVYDETDPEFKRIAAQSSVQTSGCQYGLSFLVIERSTGKFLELFFGSKSHRPEAKKVYPKLPLSQQDIDRKAAGGADVTGMEPHGPIPVTLKAKYIEREFSWHVPVVLDCSTPFTKLPLTERIVAEIQKFLTAKTEVEADPENNTQQTKKSKRAR